MRVLFYNGTVFGLRGGQEHRYLTPSQFQIFDSANGEFIRFTSRNTKIVSGGLKTRRVVPKVIELFGDPQNDHCIVRIYKAYLSFIPKDGAFYKKPLENRDGKVPFSVQNVGINQLSQYMKIMFSNADINTEGRKITNNSGRHYQVSTNLNAGMPDFDTKGRSGHRSDALERITSPTFSAKSLYLKVSTPVGHLFASPVAMPTAKPSAHQTGPISIDEQHAKATHIPSTPTRSTVVNQIQPRGNDCLKIVVPDFINKVILYKGTCETVVILNN